MSPTSETSPTSGRENHVPVSFTEETRTGGEEEKEKEKEKKKMKTKPREMNAEEWKFLKSKPDDHPYHWDIKVHGLRVPKFLDACLKRTGWEHIDCNRDELPNWAWKIKDEKELSHLRENPPPRHKDDENSFDKWDREYREKKRKQESFFRRPSL